MPQNSIFFFLPNPLLFKFLLQESSEDSSRQAVLSRKPAVAVELVLFCITCASEKNLLSVVAGNAETRKQRSMPYPDFRELSVANVGSNLRPRAATRDLRASVICYARAAVSLSFVAAAAAEFAYAASVLWVVVVGAALTGERCLDFVSSPSHHHKTPRSSH
jgi:hypothetical protein